MTGQAGLDGHWLIGELIDVGFALQGMVGNLARLSWPPGMPGDPGELVVCTDQASDVFGELAEAALVQLGLVAQIGRACGRVLDGIVDVQKQADDVVGTQRRPGQWAPSTRTGHEPGW